MPEIGNGMLPVGRYFDLSTDRVPAHERGMFWRDTVLNRSDAEIHPDFVAGRFSAQVRGFVGGRAELRDGRSDAVVLRRRAARCRRDGGDEILLSAIVTADELVRYRNDFVACLISPGRFLVNDMAVPFEIEMPRYRAINFRLPRGLVSRRFGTRQGGFNGRLLRETPLTSLLFSQLVQLADAMPAMDDTARQLALDATVDFALATLRLEVETARESGAGAAWDESPHWSGLWLAAERFIERNLDRADLNPDTLARALRCSRSQVYRLFERHDTAVMDHIRAMRLERCREMLADPTCRLSIAEIAARCGMENPSAFSRGFRRRYGLTPGEARRTGVTRPQ